MRLQLCFAPGSAPVLAQRQPTDTGNSRTSSSRPSVAKKPRAPPRFSEHRSVPRRWRPAETQNIALQAVAGALEQWRLETGQPAGYLPSDSHLRRCEAARKLRLQSLIVRAGGHRAVQAGLDLRPIESSASAVKGRKLAGLADGLSAICSKNGLPPPTENFPDKKIIQKLCPQLGNRIAAFPGRNGYNRLAEYVRAKATNIPHEEPAREQLARTRKWGARTNPDQLRMELLAYQIHPQVLPRLNSLPTEIATAIQRQGGAAVFAKAHGMVQGKDWTNVLRFALLIRWLSDEVSSTVDDSQGGDTVPESYQRMIEYQIAHPPKFPSADQISGAGFMTEVQRYGGRKSLAIRLGFSRAYGIRDVFLGPFSVAFAADILEYAAQQVYVSSDGSVGMPTVECLSADGRPDLAAAVGYFGGEEAVGRRVGLVPLERSQPNCSIVDYE